MNPWVRKSELARLTGKPVSKGRGRPPKMGMHIANGCTLCESRKTYAKHP